MLLHGTMRGDDGPDGLPGRSVHLPIRQGARMEQGRIGNLRR